MTTASRYKSVTNGTGAALTVAGVDQTDGNDRLVRTVVRPYAAADIGAGAGQTQNAGGCIIDALPVGTNVLAIIAQTFRAGRSIDNLTLNAGAQIASLTYSYNAADGTIRVVDAGNNAAVLLVAGDITMATLLLGPA